MLLMMNLTAFSVAKLYSNSSSDLYNHMAFIRAIKNNMIIRSSAFRERNTYPPLIHFMFGFLERLNLINYTSLLVLVLNQCVIYIWSLQYYDPANALLLVAISLLSTSLFIDLRSYNARIIGILLFNSLLLFILLLESNGLNYLVVIAASMCVFLLVMTSRFAHQMVLFFLIPSSIIFGQLYLPTIYFLTLLTIITTNTFHLRPVLLGHVKHVYYYYKRGVDFWLPGGYWREINNISHKKSNVNIKRLIFILAKEPVSIVAFSYLFYIFGYSKVPFSFTDVILIFATIFYIVVAISERLDNFIGDSYRYWEYISLALAISIVDTVTQYSYNALPVFLIFCLIFLVFSVYLFFSLNKMVTKLKRENRFSFDEGVCQAIEELPFKKVLTVPISLSNVFAVNTSKKYFYGYTYFGFWYLEKAGLYPYFKKENNILSKQYIKVVVIDSSQVPIEFTKMLSTEYGFRVYKEIGTYSIYTK